MQDGTTDTMSVTFPATATFSRMGRVSIAGLALRLGVDVQRVENLRMAVDAAVQALEGPGYIEMEASWSPGHLRIDVDNEAIRFDPAGAEALLDRLLGLVDQAGVREHRVELQLHD
jgi:anti-sigma regulatory factor (Ser/Thr protein kinase)